MQENETITLILGIGVTLFAIATRTELRRVIAWRTLLLSFLALAAAWVITVLEEWFWPQGLNLLEHLCYTVSVLAFAAWCWQAFGQGERAS